MRRTIGERAWTWSVSVAALVLGIWAVIEFVRPTDGDVVRMVRTPATAEFSLGGGVEEIELYRLLPDATDDLGRAVRIDGTVVGDASSGGFWVRDLRDNVIFVAFGTGGSATDRRALGSGDPVRVRGVVALLPPREQAERLHRAGLVIPASAVVIRDVKVVSAGDGIEVLRD